MDFGNLARRLEQLHPQLAAAGGLQPPTPGFPRSFGFDIEREVAALIDASPALPAMRPFGGVHLNVIGGQLASSLLDMVAQQGPAAAVAWLNKVVAADAADVRVVAEIRGLSVSGELELPGGIHLSAPATAPASARIAELDPPRFPTDFMRAALEPPTTVAWVELRGLRWAEAEAGDRARGEALWALHRAILGMALIPTQAPLIARTWSEFVDPDLERALLGRGWLPTLEDGAPLDQPVQPVHQGQLAPVAAYMRLPSELAGKLELALSRVSLARRRRQISNQAIEICTALESLFGDGNEKTELSYRLRLRAALFLGETLEERKAIRADLGKLYDLRSRAVHGARTKPTLPPGEAMRLIQTGSEVVTRTVLKIIADRAWPDWAVLELDPPTLTHRPIADLRDG